MPVVRSPKIVQTPIITATKICSDMIFSDPPLFGDSATGMYNMSKSCDSALIYAVISLILVEVDFGVLLMAALAILSIIFPIIGGVKATEGEVWSYPLSIRIFK